MQDMPKIESGGSSDRAPTWRAYGLAFKPRHCNMDLAPLYGSANWLHQRGTSVPLFQKNSPPNERPSFFPIYGLYFFMFRF